MWGADFNIAGRQGIENGLTMGTGTRGGLDSKLVPYLARHAFGTTAMRETGNAFAVMKAMGHASVLSMEPYQHQQVDQLTAVMNRRNEAAAAAKAAALAT